MFGFISFIPIIIGATFIHSKLGYDIIKNCKSRTTHVSLWKRRIRDISGE